MDNPRDKQFVRAILKDSKVVGARFYANMLSENGAAGYEYRYEGKSYHCPASHVMEWQDDSANDPVGYDLSRPSDAV